MPIPSSSVSRQRTHARNSCTNSVVLICSLVRHWRHGARSTPVRRLTSGRVELETPLSIKSARFFGLGLLSGRFLGRPLFSVRGGCGVRVECQVLEWTPVRGKPQSAVELEVELRYEIGSGSRSLGESGRVLGAAYAHAQIPVVHELRMRAPLVIN